MNLKVTNLIAIQFGMFVGIMSWLAYSHSPAPEPRRLAATLPESALNAGATVASALDPGDQRPYATNLSADRETNQPADGPRPQWELNYYQSIAPRPYQNAEYEDRFVPVDLASSASLDQQPEVVQSEYVEPEPVVYSQAVQNVFYNQPIQIVSFPNHRRRCQPTRLSDTPLNNPRNCPDRGNFHPNNIKPVLPPNVNTPPNPPAPGIKPRPTSRQPIVTGTQPKRVPFPPASASSGAGRRFTP